MAKDHLDSMEPADLAERTRELLAVIHAVGCGEKSWAEIINATKPLRPTPLDPVRQQLQRSIRLEQSGQ
jgi:hypothetical protein